MQSKKKKIIIVQESELIYSLLPVIAKMLLGSLTGSIDSFLYLFDASMQNVVFFYPAETFFPLGGF